MNVQPYYYIFKIGQPGDKSDDLIEAGTGGRLTHCAIAISETEAMEMHITGIRTRKINDFAEIEVLVPPDTVLERLPAAVRKAYRKRKWSRYAWLQGASQGIHRWTGIRLPFYLGTSCSELLALISKFARVARLKRPNRYDPQRLRDFLVIDHGWTHFEVKQ